MVEVTYSHGKAALITGIVRIYYYYSWMVFWIYCLDEMGDKQLISDEEKERKKEKKVILAYDWTYYGLNFGIALAHFIFGFLLAYAGLKMNKIFAAIWIILTAIIFIIFLVHMSLEATYLKGKEWSDWNACWFGLNIIVDLISFGIGIAFLFCNSSEGNNSSEK